MITPNASSEDDSEIFLGEDNDGTYGMNIKYDGVDNKLYIGGKSSSTIYGPHLSINRNDGKVGVGTTDPKNILDVDGDVGGLMIGYKKVFVDNSNIADAGELLDGSNGYVSFKTPSHGRVLITADFYYASGWHSTTDQVEVKLVNSTNTSTYHGRVGVCQLIKIMKTINVMLNLY